MAIPREVEKVVKLNERQRAILIGKILGDGCLEKNGNFTRLKISQGIKQKDYVFWLCQELLPFVAGEPYLVKAFHKKRKRFYYHWRFATRSISLFDSWRETFYSDGKKYVPDQIGQLLNNPLSLAVWYMDDGFRRRDCRGVYLCTSGFTKGGQTLLMEALKINYGIETKIHFAAGYAKIYIPSAFVQRFCQIIEPHMLPSFSYKLF